MVALLAQSKREPRNGERRGGEELGSSVGVGTVSTQAQPAPSAGLGGTKTQDAGGCAGGGGAAGAGVAGWGPATPGSAVASDGANSVVGPTCPDGLGEPEFGVAAVFGTTTPGGAGFGAAGTPVAGGEGVGMAGVGMAGAGLTAAPVAAGGGGEGAATGLGGTGVAGDGAAGGGGDGGAEPTGAGEGATVDGVLGVCAAAALATDQATAVAIAPSRKPRVLSHAQMWRRRFTR